MLPLQLPWPTAQTRWKSQIDPVLSNPLLQGRLLSNVSLVVGPNVINHGLGRDIQGYFFVSNSAVINTSDNFLTNQTPSLTFTITSDAKAVVSIWAF